MLNRKVIVEERKFILQRHQPLVALGNTLEQAGQSGCHLGNARRVLDGGHPLDAVEGIIKEMGVDLVLQHPVFQIPLGALVLEPLFHQGGDADRQAVDAAANVAHLVVPLNRGVGGKVTLTDALKLVLNRPDRFGNHAAQQSGKQHPQHKDAEDTENHRGGQRGEGMPQTVERDGARDIQPAAADGVAKNQLVAVRQLPDRCARVKKFEGGRTLCPGEGSIGQCFKTCVKDAPGTAVHNPEKVTLLKKARGTHDIRDEGGGDRNIDPTGVTVRAGYGAGDGNVLHRSG